MEDVDNDDPLHKDVEGQPNMADNDDLRSNIHYSFKRLYEKASTSLYLGLKISIVSATIVIINICVLCLVRATLSQLNSCSISWKTYYRTATSCRTVIMSQRRAFEGYDCTTTSFMHV